MRRLVLALVLLVWPTLAAGQGQQLHGADSVFSGHGVAIAWGVLRGPAEEQNQVVIRIVPTGEPYAYVSVEAVDPFSRERRWVLPGRPLADLPDVRSPRRSFADLPRREIHLYRTADDWQAAKPALTVYYLGVPDTTPEFPSEAALLRYLAGALAHVHGTSRGKTP